MYKYVCMFESRYQYDGYMLCFAMLCYVTGYDIRTPELAVAPLHMKLDTTSTPV